MLLQGWPFGAESERAGSSRRRLASRRIARAVRGLGGGVVALALLIGPTAAPLAAWVGLPLAAASCACPPAHCRCPHGGAAHQQPAGGAAAAQLAGEAADECASRPSCPLRAAQRPAGAAGDADASAAAPHAAQAGRVDVSAAPAATSHTVHASRARVAATPGHHSPSPPPAAARCSISTRCGGEAPAATATATWLQAAAGSGAGWAAPAGPGDPSPPAAAPRLLDNSRSPELPPPRRIAPIA
jgi:hypothetical protein